MIFEYCCLWVLLTVTAHWPNQTDLAMVCPSKDQSCICTIPERERERCQEPHLTAGTKHNISQQNRIRRAHLSVNLLRSLSSNSEKKSSISAGDGESNSRLLLRRAILGVVLRVVLVVADFLEDNLGISFAFVSCCCVGGGVFGLLSLIVGTSNLVSRDWSWNCPLHFSYFCFWDCSCNCSLHSWTSSNCCWIGGSLQFQHRCI